MCLKYLVALISAIPGSLNSKSLSCTPGLAGKIQNIIYSGVTLLSINCLHLAHAWCITEAYGIPAKI